MDNTDVTNPAEAEAPKPEVTPDEVPLAAEDAEIPADEDGEASEQEEIEYLDIEKDGKTYKVPKPLEDLLLFQKDYTQKTQTLAEQRRELEAQRQAAEWEAQTRQELFREEAQLLTVSQRLEQFREVDWQGLAQNDPQGYMVAQAEYTQLKDVHDRLSGHVEGRRSELATLREQTTANAISKAMEHLNKPNPNLGWDGKFDAAKRESLTKFGMELGFTNEELANTSHPLMIQTLNLARIGAEALKKQAASLKQQQPQANPVPQVATGKSRSGPANPDKLPMDQWIKWRNSQVAKAKG